MPDDIEYEYQHCCECGGAHPFGHDCESQQWPVGWNGRDMQAFTRALGVRSSDDQA